MIDRRNATRVGCGECGEQVEDVDFARGRDGLDGARGRFELEHCAAGCKARSLQRANPRSDP